MKGSSYRDRDYAFGQAMLTLRTTIGLTQAGLARHLDISRKAVGEWEAGLTYPKTGRSIRVSPDRKTLASCGDDNTIQGWNLESGEHLRTLRCDRP